MIEERRGNYITNNIKVDVSLRCENSRQKVRFSIVLKSVFWCLKCHSAS